MVLARTGSLEELFELFKNEPLKAILLLGVLTLCVALLHKWIDIGARQRGKRGITIWDLWHRPIWVLLRGRLSDEELWNSDGTYRQNVNQNPPAPDDADIVWRNHHKRRMKRSRPRSKKRQVRRYPLRQ